MCSDDQNLVAIICSANTKAETIPPPAQPCDTDALDEALEESFPASDPLPVQPGTCISNVEQDPHVQAASPILILLSIL